MRTLLFFLIPQTFEGECPEVIRAFVQRRKPLLFYEFVIATLSLLGVASLSSVTTSPKLR